ncbi:MAG: cytochrome c3 family protein, partial [Pseudomonadota bacterium]
MTKGRRSKAALAATIVFAAAAGIAAGLASASPATTEAAPVAPAGPAAPSPLIYPGESLPIRFDHARHARLGATCEGCHTMAAGSTVAADNLIPGEAACRACHKIDRANPTKVVAAGQGAARCDACHVDLAGHGWMPPGSASADLPAEPPRVVMPRPNLKFNHRLHAARGAG